jgi:nitrite reductase/ring-hydroxylating ferredoxin subunit
MKYAMSELNETPDKTEAACADLCPIERGHFLRSTAFAALAGLAGVGFLASSASAQSVGSISPSRTQGKTLTYALPSRDGASIDADNGVIVARVKNAVYALSITCPHRAVTQLDWIQSANEFRCPKHNAHFQADGALIDGRPDRSMDRFSIRKTGQTIAVDTASILHQDVDQNAWSRAFVSAA